ncbi:hypothetical protein BST37_05930 [Mycobacterium noviomagense]|nr:hypothetical protein BST37_05930 [Mycobacterium noviomagense]
MPNYPYAPYPIPSVPAKRNTVGLIALIASIIGFVFACIPGALIIGWVLLPIALILGIVGVCLSGMSKGTSIAAVITSIVGIVVGVVVFLTVVSNAFSNAFHKSDLSPAPSAASGAPAPGNNDETPTSSSNKPGSRENPLPIGEPVQSRDWQVTLGAPHEAWAQIAAENEFNDPPKPGMEYWIVPVTATYTGDRTGNAGSDITVKFVGSDNRTYDESCGVIPNPLSDVGDLYKGGSAEGNVCVEVPAGADGLWTLTTGFGNPAFFTAK